MSFRHLLLRSLRRPSPFSNQIRSFVTTIPYPTTIPYRSSIPYRVRGISSREASSQRKCINLLYNGNSEHAHNLHARLEPMILDGDLDVASSVLRHEVDSVNQPRLLTCNLLLDAMSNAGRHEEAVSLFYKFFEKSKMFPDDYSYNILIKACCSAGQVDHALQVFDEIRWNPYLLYPRTYSRLMSGLVSANRMSDAEIILREMNAVPLRRHAAEFNILISGYLDRNDVENADRLFNEMLSEHPERRTVMDGLVYATYMDYHFKHDSEKEAMETYQKFLTHKVPMCPEVGNAVLEVLVKHGKSSEANALFANWLNTAGHIVNSTTFNIMVNECFRLGKVSEALSIFKKRGQFETEEEPFVMDDVGYNNIIGKLCDIGMVDEATKLFAEMLSKSVEADVSTFSILFDAYFKEERIDDVLKWFNYLLFNTDLKPSSAMLNYLFTRVINKGRIEEAGAILGKMLKMRQDTNRTTFEAVLAELCKHRKLDHIEDVLGHMATQNVDVTPTLCDSVHEAFANEERFDHIKELLRRPIELSPVGLQHA